METGDYNVITSLEGSFISRGDIDESPGHINRSSQNMHGSSMYTYGSLRYINGSARYLEVEGLEGESRCYSYGLLAMLCSGGYYFGYYMGIWNPLGRKHLWLNLGVPGDIVEYYQG